MGEDGLVGEIGVEAVEGVPLRRGRRRLAHAGHPNQESQRIESRGGAVPVRVHHQARLQHAVVVSGLARIEVTIGEALTCSRPIAERVAHLQDEQVVSVVGDRDLRVEGGGMERVPGAERQEEVAPGVGQLLRRRVGLARRVEDPAGRDPPVIVRIGPGEQAGRAQVLAQKVAAAARPLGSEHRRGRWQEILGRLPLVRALVDLGQQSRREGQLVALAPQAERLEHPESEQAGEIVGAVEGAGLLQEAALPAAAG